MSVTIIPVPVFDKVRVRDLVVGDWISGSPTGPWHMVLETGDTALLVGDRRADGQVVEVIDPDGAIYRIDVADVPTRRY